MYVTRGRAGENSCNWRFVMASPSVSEVGGKTRPTPPSPRALAGCHATGVAGLSSGSSHGRGVGRTFRWTMPHGVILDAVGPYELVQNRLEIAQSRVARPVAASRSDRVFGRRRRGKMVGNAYHDSGERSKSVLCVFSDSETMRSRAGLDNSHAGSSINRWQRTA
jgi:hypothetical protein